MARSLFREMQDAYYQAYEEATLDDSITEALLMANEKRLENQARIDEIRSRFNRREKYDDDGNLIPDDSYNKDKIIANFASDEGKSWMCDKCMAINFGCQTACPECGDIKDGKDEEL